MATKYVTLKDSNGDTLYPQAVATNLAPGSIGVDEIDDRLFRMLAPHGTEITANKDINTIEFLSVGNYYCILSTTAGTLLNTPEQVAFNMEVFSPINPQIDDETSSSYCYRIRLLTTWEGHVYIQSCFSDGTAGVFTYDSWRRIDGANDAPLNYASYCTLHAGSYNANSQQVLLYPNGDVSINVTLILSSNVAAKTNIDLLTLPTAFAYNKNIVIGATSNPNTVGAAYFQNSTRKLRFFLKEAASSGSEISVFGQWNIRV